ncbi:hypothetical protein N431DRAFT_482750 [Stipitochalara longipes BDJ]|nr:hypothetical protein N431DRAFT_482750 [Stipitochalara longipes BDJ]
MEVDLLPKGSAPKTPHASNFSAKQIGYDSETGDYIVSSSLAGTLVGLVVGVACLCCECNDGHERDRLGKERRLQLGDDISCQVVRDRIDHLVAVASLANTCKDEVTFLVGRNRQEIQCNLAMLTHFSSNTEKLLSGTPSRIVEIPEEEVYIVTAFIHWLKTGVVDENSLSATSLCQFPLFHEELWAFAEKLKCDSLCDLIVDFLVYKYRRGKITPASAKYAYNHTTGPELKAMVRDVLVYWSPFKKKYMRNIRSEAITEWEDFFHEGGKFVLDVIKKEVDRREIEDRESFTLVFNEYDYYIRKNGSESGFSS